MPGTDGDDDRHNDRESRSRLGRVGQFTALVVAIVIDLAIRRMIGG